ncbi:MAG TPA: amidase family protein, partial [Mycobacterium sp.]
MLSATEVARAVRAGEISPVEVVEAALDQAALWEDSIHAFCTLDADGALRTARAQAEALARGIDPGPLAGVPVGVKDLIATGGLRTTFGSWSYRDYVPDSDDVSVARLRAAGAIVLGKTNASEFGYAATGDNELFASTRNPWNPALSPGGSSAGSAAAVAAGIVPLALGSDGGGSIRIPAALCGITGFKPSMGRIPAYPGCKDERLPGVSSWDALEHIGPMARTVDDVALAYRVLAGPDPRDRFSLPHSPPVTQGSLRGKRVALSMGWGYTPIDPSVAEVVQAAAQVFADEFGCELVVADPGFDDPFTAFGALIASETDLRGMRELASAGRTSPYVREVLDRTWTAEDFTDARRSRQQVCRVMASFMADYDLLLTPTSPVPAFPPGDIGPTVIDGLPVHPAYWLSTTLPLNLTGQPAISVPAGLTTEGLPVGLQIAGRHLADQDVLAAASAYESA